MSEETKTTTKKELEPGMYNVSFVKDFGTYKKDDTAVYHSSTAGTLAKKGIVKVDGKIKVYMPKTMKK